MPGTEVERGQKFAAPIPERQMELPLPSRFDLLAPSSAARRQADRGFELLC